LPKLILPGFGDAPDFRVPQSAASTGNSGEGAETIPRSACALLPEVWPCTEGSAAFWPRSVPDPGVRQAQAGAAIDGAPPGQTPCPQPLWRRGNLPRRPPQLDAAKGSSALLEWPGRRSWLAVQGRLYTEPARPRPGHSPPRSAALRHRARSRSSRCAGHPRPATRELSLPSDNSPPNTAAIGRKWLERRETELRPSARASARYPVGLLGCAWQATARSLESL